MSNNFKTIEAQPFDHNPRKISNKKDQALEETLRRLGDLSGVIFNRRTGKIPGGNQRSRKFNINECQIDIFLEFPEPDAQGTVAFGTIIWEGNRYFYREVDWNEETEKEANIVANKAGGDWDFKVLEQHWDVDLLLQSGFLKSELKWTNAIEAFQSDEQQVTRLKKTYTKTGDIYQLNEHRIMCGDSTDPDQVKQLLDGATIDMVLTHPPYNVDYDANRLKASAKERKVKNDNMPDEQFSKFIRYFYRIYTSYLKPGGVWYVFHADSKGHIFRTEFIKCGNYLAQVLQWVKDQKVMGTSDYHWQNEPVLYGIKPDKELAKRIIETLEKELGITLQVYDTYHQSAIYGWKKGGSHRWSSDRSQSTVLNYNRTKLNDLHPTMKPVTLLKYLIHNSSIEREIIADAFLGSGSTLIAADETDRRCYGMELDPPNVDIAVRRWVATRIQKDQVWTISKNGKDISSQKWLTDGQKATAQTS